MPLSFRAQVGTIVEDQRVQNFIMAVIVLNAVSLGMETSGRLTADYGTLLYAFDLFALIVFCVEIGAKLIHRDIRFFKDGWNVFDFLVVAIALIPASGPFAVLRALRILLALRLLTVVPAMKRVIGALISALPGMGSVFSIIFLVFYVAAVLATNFFGDAFSEWFGSIGKSLFSLFQIMTLESWSMGIVRPVMIVYPHAWAFFVPFIMITTFAIVNLFIGIIVDAMQSQHTEEQDILEAGNKELLEGEQAILTELKALRAEVRALRENG